MNLRREARQYFGDKTTVRVEDSPLAWNNMMTDMARRDADNPRLHAFATDILLRIKVTVDERRKQMDRKYGVGNHADPILCLPGDFSTDVPADIAVVLCHRGIRMADGRRVWNGQPQTPSQFRSYFESLEDYLMETV